MPLTPINVGAAANDNTGDSLRNAFIKVNDNCTYLDGKAPNAHTHPLSELTQSGATNGQVPTWNGTAWAPATPTGGGGSGSVTSVGLSLPNIFSVTNSPVTGSGTLTATFTTQTAGTVLAAPINNNAAPSFRALVASDIPALNYEAAGAVAAHAALTDTAHGMTVYGADFVTAASATAARIKLALGTSATLNVPATGDATNTQVVLGTDTRLTNSRTPTAHVHAAGDITSGTLDIGRIPTGTSAATVCIGNDARLSDPRAPLSHAHGNISNAGAIGSTANLPLITTASGVITTGAFGTAANTFCQGNDTRLSDSRTPTAHTHAVGDLTQSGATTNQVIGWNGSAWAPTTVTSGSGGNISGPNSGITDNAIVRWDTNNTTIQNSVVTVSDNGEFAGANSVAFSTSPNGSSAIGKVLWDTTNKTLSLGIGAGSVSALLGVDSHILVRNTTGSQINKGQVVRVNGASTGNMTVALAQGNNDANTTTTIGVAAENIANSGTGMVIVTGLLGGLDTSTWTAGDMLFISATTPGLLVNAAPAAPNHAVRMGYVVSSNPNSGIIYVNVDNGYELDELHDVAYPTTLANNDFLVYTTNRWENKTPANARTALGLGTAATSNTGDFATASHVHGNITNAGAIGATANLPLITTTSGVVTTGSFGTAANTFCQGNDSRLSDARTPLAHTHAAADVISGTFDIARIPTGTSATTVCIGNDSRLSDARTPTSHTHGNITNAGAIGATANLPLITTTSGVITTGSFGTAASSFCEGNDSRLSDARTPLSHTHGNITNAGAIGTTANLPLITTTSGVVTTGSFGTAANTFCEGNDSRLADSRTPTAHAASHGSGGTDALTLAQSQITNLTSDLAAKAPTASPTFTGQVVTDAGTVTAPSITATGDLNTGFYYPAADSIGITTGGNDRVRIGANGAVGIGTTSTGSWDANSLVIAAAQGTNGQLIIQQTGGSGAADVGANINFYGNNGSASNTYGEIRVRKENATVGNNASYISFCNVASGGTSVAERMRITAAGSVLINAAALSTTATDGFLYIPSCPGAPTGTPTTQTGRNPLIVDSTNSKLYFYAGSWLQALSGTVGIANGGTGQTTATAAFNGLAPGTSKGDLIVHDGTNEVRLEVGATNGHVLTIDSTTATGLKWAAASGGGGSGGSTNVWIPAAQFIPRTTSGCGIDSREQATGNINTDELLYDQAAIEYAQAMVVMPSNYNNGTVTARFYWTASAGTASQSCIWAIRARAFGDNVAVGQALGTAVSVNDAYFSANQMHVSDATGAMTIDGTPAANKAVVFEVYRDASNVNDSLAADARLLGVEISYTAA